MSLRVKITLLVGVIVAVAVGLGSLGSRWATERELRDSVDRSLVQRASTLSNTLLDGPVADASLIGGEGDQGEHFVEQVVVDGVPVRSNTSQTLLPFDPSVVADLGENANSVVFRDVVLQGQNHRIVARRHVDGIAIVQVARNTSEIDLALVGIDLRRVQIVVATTIFAATAGWLLVRRTIAPIEALGEAVTEAAATQNFGRPIPVKGNDEVGRLAQDFNTMLRAVQSSRDQQQRLVVDAGHELRTPLTSLGTSLELLGRGGLADGDEERLRSRVVIEFLELSSMADALVQLGTDPAISEALEQCDLVDIAVAAIEVARTRHDGEILLRSCDEAPLIGQPVMLHRAISNLIENAYKFGPTDGQIVVEVQVDRIVVSDEGPGFIGTDLDRIFDRFYRSTHSNGVAGSGLGLSIVKYAADAHGGEVFATNMPEGGACVGFSCQRGR